VFTIDEDNYLVTVHGLRHGTLHVPGTGGLSPSPELLYFDPGPRARQVMRTPVSSAAPPLYAVLALPASYLGVRGLIGLNILAFLVCCLLVFTYAARCTTTTAAPWVAMIFFGAGTYAIEYAQGMWPHMLAVALSFGGMTAALKAARSARPVWAALAGLLVGLATGVRYQNLVLAGCVGLAAVLWSRRHLRTGLMFGGGMGLPLLSCSLINHVRLGSWNPVSKNARYLDLGAGRIMHPLLDAFASLWVRLVDFSSHPPPAWSPHDLHQLLVPHPRTGAQVFGGGLKKAWLQSCPWLVLAFVGLVRSWLPGSRASDQTPLRMLSVVVGGVLLLFAVAGFSRTDAICFNQRYFMELLPPMAVALAVAVEHCRAPRRVLLAGGAGGVVLVALCLIPPADSELRQLALLKLPILIAGALALGWLLARKSHGLLCCLLGLAFAWSLAVHLGDDLPASRRHRHRNRLLAEQIATVLPDAPVALFAYWGMKDSLGPLQLNRRLVVVDPWIDHGEDAPRLVRELLARNDRVVVLARGFPREIFQTMATGHRVSVLAPSPLRLLELSR
jgi:hypothetical protein